MAEQWNGVDARLYREFKLTKLARLILAYVIAACPNQYGSFDPSPEHEVVDWFEGLFERPRVQAAFEEIVTTGIAVRFRCGECLWLVKKFRRALASNSVSSYKHLQGVANELARYPEISAQFWTLYGMPLTEIAKGFPDKANPFPDFGNNNIPSDSLPFPTISIPDTTRGGDANASLPAATPPAAGKRKPNRPTWPADTDWNAALEVAVAKLSEPAKVSFKAWTDARNAGRVRGIQLSVVVKDLTEILLKAHAERLPMAGLDHGFMEATKCTPPAEKPNFVIVCARNWAKRQGPTDWDGNPAPVAEQREHAEQRERARERQAAMEEAEAQWQRDKAHYCNLLGIPDPGPLPDDMRADWLRKQQQRLVLPVPVEVRGE